MGLHTPPFPHLWHVSTAGRKGRLPRTAAPREPHLLAETHALPLSQETQTEGKMRGEPSKWPKEK